MVPDSVVKKIEFGTIYFSYASCFTVSSPGKAQRISALKRSASVSIWKLPPWRPTKLFTIARPRPEPSVLRDSSPRTKRSVISSGLKVSSVAEIFFRRIIHLSPSFRFPHKLLFPEAHILQCYSEDSQRSGRSSDCPDEESLFLLGKWS